MKKILITAFLFFTSIVAGICQNMFQKTYGYDSTNYHAADIIQTFDGGYLLTGMNFIYTAPNPLPYEFLYNGTFVVRTDANGDTLWTRFFDEYNYGYFTRIFEMPDSSIVLLGTKNASNLCGGVGIWFPPYRDFVYLKLDQNGNYIDFAQHVIDCQEVLMDAIATLDGGFAILGVHSEPGSWIYTVNPVIYKLSSTGTIQWTKNYSNQYYEVYSLLQDTNENYYFTGLIYNGIDYDALLVKTDVNGDTLFTTQIPDTSEQQGRCLINADASGNLLIMARDGSTSFNYTPRTAFYKVDATGNIIWVKKYQFVGSVAKLTPDGGFLVLGTDLTQSFYDSTDLYVVKLDANGDSLWSKNYGGIKKDIAASLCLTNDDGYAALGTKDAYNYVPEPSRYFVVKDTLTVTSIADDQSNQYKITLFPNPFRESSSLEIKSNNYLYNPTIIIYDSFGREMPRLFHITMRKESQFHVVFEISPTINRGGLYCYKIVDKAGIISIGKFIVN